MGEAVARRRGLVAIAAIAVVLAAAVIAIARAGDASAVREPAQTAAIRLGLPDSPLLAAAHLAGERDPGAATAVRAARANDVGYALLAGSIDAGFVEAAKARALLSDGRDGDLEIVALVTFPFGATVVGRKGAIGRLEDLAGRRLAVSSTGCALYQRFRDDAAARGIDPSHYRVITIPFDAMVTALEAGQVDAAVMRGASSLIAARAGHPVIYQNWQMEAGDECCPPVIAQTEFLLLSRGHAPAIARLSAALVAADQAKPSELRAAAARATGFPADLLAAFPTASIALPDATTRATFAGRHRHAR